MPETIEDYYARVMDAADDQGRLTIPADGIPYWEIFPFEPEGLRLKAIGPLVDAEEPRNGEGGKPCGACNHVDERNSVDAEMWRDEHWRIPVDVRDANARAVIQDLVRTYGGRALGRAA